MDIFNQIIYVHLRNQWLNEPCLKKHTGEKMNRTSDQYQTLDVFARIAAQRREMQHAELIQPEPPLLYSRLLPAGESDSVATFHPHPKLDSPVKLQQELARWRKRVKKYLRNLAPPASSSRIVLPLESFDWRIESGADQQDFPGTLMGQGEWQHVAIPHYGGPVGRAVAFYRTTFKITQSMLAVGALFACFKSVDYKAHIFINGAFFGSHEGFFSPFELEFTKYARIGENILLVRVENEPPPVAGDGSWGMKVDGDKLYAATGPGWDDPELGWHHCPPGMGIYQAVSIEARPALHQADLYVRPLLEEQRAELWIEVFNTTVEPLPVSFSVSVYGQNFSKTVFRDRLFEPQQKAGPGINNFRFSFDLPDARLWDLDTPWLYQIQVSLPNGDSQTRQFGMRSFRMDTENKPYGRFFLNGREIRLRGANTMGFEQQDVIQEDFDQLRDDILLAKICHMNFWRLTQRPVQSEVYEMCDRLGLMTQTDLPLFGYLPRHKWSEAVRQAGEMERLVRGHACNILVTYINEPFPGESGEKSHRQCTRPELEMFFEAASHAVHLVNPDRVIKPVDGDYDPPGPGLPDNHCYTCWYNGHGIELGRLHKGYWQAVKPDWYYGCGEFGAEGLDPVNVMRKYYPKDWLPQSPEEERDWTPDRIKEAQTGKFHYFFIDTQHTLEDWVNASQRHQAWATRLMTEAFRRDSRMNSFAIHLFIDAWPSGWMKAIMDVDRQPKPAYFAYREALTPLMVNIRTDRWTFTSGEMMRFECWVCNDTQEVPAGAMLRYQLEMSGKVIFSQQVEALIDQCSSTFQGYLDLTATQVETRTSASLRLALSSADGKILHDTAIVLEIFPLPVAMPPERQVLVIGAMNGKAARLAREVGYEPFFTLPPGSKPHDLTILVDDFDLFKNVSGRIETLVQKGSLAVLLEPPTGVHWLFGFSITVEECGMDHRHFVSRASGHPLVKEFQPADFRLWYDPTVDRITPLLETCFRAEGWNPILLTGNGGWSGSWEPALAAAEIQVGAGICRVCNLKISGRISSNPAASLFARKLIES
jgi:hypothetical protein